jgi:hypothetical protein
LATITWRVLLSVYHAEHIREGPGCLTFLGIEVDTVASQAVPPSALP